MDKPILSTPGRSDRPERAINLNKEWRRHQLKRSLAIVVMGLGVVVAVGHVFEHSGALRLMSNGAEDLFIGWPAAGGIFVIGAILYGRD